MSGDGSNMYMQALFQEAPSGARCKLARTLKILSGSSVKLTATLWTGESSMKKLVVLERTIEHLDQLAEGVKSMTITPSIPSTEARTCFRRLAANSCRAATQCWNVLRVRELPGESLFLNDMVCFFYNQIYRAYKVACDEGSLLSYSGNRQLASLDWARFFIEVETTKYAREELEMVKLAIEKMPSEDITRHRLHFLNAVVQELAKLPVDA